MWMRYNNESKVLNIVKQVSLVKVEIAETKKVEELYFSKITGIVFKDVGNKEEDIFKCAEWMFNRAEWKDNIGTYFTIQGSVINEYCEITEQNGCPNDAVYVVFPLEEIIDCDQVYLDFEDQWNGLGNAQFFSSFIEDLIYRSYET